MFIFKEGENEETPPYAVVASNILLVFADKTWAIQAMTMWSQLSYNNIDEFLKFEDDSQNKSELVNDNVDTHVN